MNYDELLQFAQKSIDRKIPDKEELKAILLSLWSEILIKSNQHHSVLAIMENSVRQSATVDNDVRTLVIYGLSLLARKYLSEEDVDLMRSMSVDFGFNPLAFMSNMKDGE